MVNLMTAIALAALYVPQSNDDTLSQSPLSCGETAFVVRDKAATLHIGKREVADRSALRGYRADAVARQDFVVSVSGGFTYDGANDRWTLAMVGADPFTNTVTITTAGRDIHSATMNAWWTHGVGGYSPDSTLTIDGNTATFVLVWQPNAVNLKIESVRVTSLTFGDPDGETDLNQHIFRVIDSVGSSSLGEWRKWAANLYNGNRGENWSAYPAYRTVTLDGNAVAFDGKAHYTARVNTDTNLVVYAGGYPAVTVSHHGTATNGPLQITSFAVTNKVCYIGYQQDIENFDLSKLAVMETTAFTPPIVWSAVPASSLTMTDGLAVVAAQPGFAQRFFKLVYDGSIETSVVTITLSGIVNIIGDLAISGTNVMAWADSRFVDMVTMTNFIDHTNATFSNEVLQVGLNIDTNLVAAINAMTDTPIDPTTGATTVFGLLTALAAAVAWLKKNKLTKGMTAGVPDDPNVASLFSSDNTSLMGVVRYGINTAGTIIDRKINVISAASATVPNDFTDLLIRASVSSSLAVTMPSGFTVYGDAFPGESGEWLVTITKTGSAEAYVRSIKMEVPNA